MAALIQPSIQELLQVGNATFRDFANLKVLQTLMSSNVGATKYSTFQAQYGVAGYPVTAGKTLRVRGIQIIQTTTVQGLMGLGYGDTDVGLSSSTLPTNGVTEAPYSIVAPNSITIQEYSVKFDVPATKYPYLFCAAIAAMTAVVRIYGYEV